MNYKLKHLSKYCCKPANETEFEAVKMASELGGVEWFGSIDFSQLYDFPYVIVCEDGDLMLDQILDCHETEIPVIDFIKNLRMTEEEAKELEDDRVSFRVDHDLTWVISEDGQALEALNDHYFRASEDGLTVTLHKKEVK